MPILLVTLSSISNSPTTRNWPVSLIQVALCLWYGNHSKWGQLNKNKIKFRLRINFFKLEFKRTMGVRGANSTCLFSGSRGEVCQIEPLKFENFAETLVDKFSRKSIVKKNLAGVQNLFSKFTLLAMASFTKIFVVTLKPKLTVLFTYPLTADPKYLPILSWQLVVVQKPEMVSENDQKITQSKRFVSPILACARESVILFFQVNI